MLQLNPSKYRKSLIQNFAKILEFFQKIKLIILGKE